MRKNIALLLILMSTLFTTFNYSMRRDDVNLPEGSADNSLITLEDVGNALEYFSNATNLANFDVNKIADYVEWKEFYSFLIDLIAKDNPEIDLIDTISLIKSEKIKELIQPSRDLVIQKVARLLTLFNMSYDDGLYFANVNEDLVINFVKATFNWIRRHQIDQKATQNIKKDLAKNALSFKISSSDTRDVILGMGSTMSLWFLGHAFCHDIMEYIEPHQFLTATIFTVFVLGISYTIITKVLKVPQHNTSLILSLMPNVCNWVISKTEVGKNVSAFVFGE
ncbi:hypothetical protein [Candidatus Babela massiliensis]|uniref:Uncharacterized protein n=1 Tax=Candidatus Babela massiliensis TaxID=673862 RepID=V6DGG1_9BACT|nr:hypothetical protein [Candidatus Babela massiliensis]CDK30655.1 hypothetical protein BABL1_gene_360 [Candidatus Babela massiliensis]